MSSSDNLPDTPPLPTMTSGNADAKTGAGTGNTAAAAAGGSGGSSGNRKKSITIGVIFALLIVVIVVVSVVATTRGSDKSNVPSMTTTTASSNDRATLVTEYINRIKLSTTPLAVPMPNVTWNTSTAEKKALAWLIYNDTLQLSPSTESQQFRLQQRYALLTIVLQFANLSDITSFLAYEDECEWVQLVQNCTAVPPVSTETTTLATDIVTDINISFPTLLSGSALFPGSTLSPDLGLLSQIVTFTARGNNPPLIPGVAVPRNCLGGNIPFSSMGTAWTNLVTFDVSFNCFTGSLPSSLGETAWTNLATFNMSYNSLSGSLPSALGMSWTNLETFDLERNSLTGSLPSSLGTTWTNLTTFDIQDNQLTGSLPSLLGLTWTNLFYFDVWSNKLSGSLPSSIGSVWTNLMTFDVSANALTGSLPSSLGTPWTNLETFDVQVNDLTGTIPNNLASNWTKLIVALFQNNSLVGSMPTEFCTVDALYADCIDEVTCDCCETCFSDATGRAWL